MTFSPQAPASVVLVRPHHFTPNPQTANDNGFQSIIGHLTTEDMAKRAYDEVSLAAETLNSLGVHTHIFDCLDKDKPDAVFPNNWFSTHAGGHIAMYPMYAENRRGERRYDIIEFLKKHYRVQEVIDYSGLEQDNLFLEGTGAMVLDHIERVAYAVKSHRTDAIILERFCTHFNFEPMVFDACDHHGQPIYHTNVLMCIASDFVLIGLDMITCEKRKAEIVDRFNQSKRQIIPLSTAQISKFCGNAIELQGTESKLLALSQTAFEALDTEQRQQIEQYCRLVPLNVSTIEQAGGSVRCMLAGIHLSPRPRLES